MNEIAYRLHLLRIALTCHARLARIALAYHAGMLAFRAHARIFDLRMTWRLRRLAGRG